MYDVVCRVLGWVFVRGRVGSTFMTWCNESKTMRLFLMADLPFLVVQLVFCLCMPLTCDVRGFLM